jgi:hypothetical protein
MSRDAELVAKYIMDHGNEKKLQEVADALGLTVERVASALDELRPSRW